MTNGFLFVAVTLLTMLHPFDRGSAGPELAEASQAASKEIVSMQIRKAGIPQQQGGERRSGCGARQDERGVDSEI